LSALLAHCAGGSGAPPAGVSVRFATVRPASA
jgi:hypothetical protein